MRCARQTDKLNVVVIMDERHMKWNKKNLNKKRKLKVRERERETKWKRMGKNRRRCLFLRSQPEIYRLDIHECVVHNSLHRALVSVQLVCRSLQIIGFYSKHFIYVLFKRKIKGKISYAHQRKKNAEREKKMTTTKLGVSKSRRRKKMLLIINKNWLKNKNDTECRVSSI